MVVAWIRSLSFWAAHGSLAATLLVVTLTSMAYSESDAAEEPQPHHVTWSAAQSKNSQDALGLSDRQLGLLDDQQDGDIDPLDVIRISGGIPDGCAAAEKQEPGKADSQRVSLPETEDALATLHKTFEFACDGLPILAYQWDISYHSRSSGDSTTAFKAAAGKQLVMVSGSVSSGMGSEPSEAEKTEWMAQDVDVVQRRSGWWIARHPSDRLTDSSPWLRTLAIEEYLTNRRTGQTAWRFRESSTGRILELHLISFDALEADIYATNQRDGHLVSTSLATDGGQWLDSPALSTFGATTTSPRASWSSGRFDYGPDQQRDGVFFDQIQAHYAAQKAQAWFASELHFQWTGPPLQVFTRYSDDSTANNARYRPGVGTSSPALLIGDGDGEKYVHLARDTDVIFHEFSHHIIYRTLKLSSGESGILHEGTADYFAYAINGDPNLAESVQPGKPWIRTAALDRGLRFDDPHNTSESHQLGQFWSAVLWQLRGEIGTGMDQIVYNALAYLPPAAKISDFFAALVNSDRALHPISTSAATGMNFCGILHAGLDWGFAQSLKGLDGSTCGLDLTQAAADSVKWRNDQRKSSDSSPTEEKKELLKSCGSFGVAAANSSVGWLFLLPLLALTLRMTHSRHFRKKSEFHKGLIGKDSSTGGSYGN